MREGANGMMEVLVAVTLAEAEKETSSNFHTDDNDIQV